MATVEELRAMLWEAEKREREEKAELAKKIHPEYEFTLRRAPEDRHWHRLYDPACRYYRLEGTVKNADQLRAVGKCATSGIMTYVYNTLSGRFVCAIGGGTQFINDPLFFAELGLLVQDHLRQELFTVTNIAEKYLKKE